MYWKGCYSTHVWGEVHHLHFSEKCYNEEFLRGAMQMGDSEKALTSALMEMFP